MDPRVRVAKAVERLDAASYYELLQVSPGVDRQTLQQHFHLFALAFHPDRYSPSDAVLKTAAKKVFERGVEAYTVLRNPAATELYDQRYREGKKRLCAEDFQSLSRVRGQGQSIAPVPPTRRMVSVDEPLAASMKTPGGRTAAERIDSLVRARRYRDAYLEAGLLEAIEPDNASVRDFVDAISAFIQRSEQR
ncbi:MAG: DnaJ domain-containing protein [Polyangiaceae bacterium]|nr:DnaJ domain-containing protein [Polyangiaceae bacterium]